MGKEAKAGEYEMVIGEEEGDEFEGDDGRVLEWEVGLPSADDLTPLAQSLIPPELASAFSIAPETPRTELDVNRASRTAISNLNRPPNLAVSSLPSLPFPLDDPMVVEADDPAAKDPAPAGGDSSRKTRRSDVEAEEAESSALRPDNSHDESARSLKRPRLVWTPQLHKRFVDVVAHLGIKNAVPKTIMQLMNVEGLTRENVASHLQKYRLYLKRMQGLSDEGPSSSDQLFASTPVPQSLHMQSPPVPMPYAVPAMIPVYGVAHHQGHSPVGMVPVNNPQGGGGAYHGFESYHPYGAFAERPQAWSSGNNFGSMVSYPYVTPNDN